MPLPLMPVRPRMVTTLRRMVGGVLSLTGVFYLLGLPEHLPTRWRLGSAQVSAVIPLTNAEAIGVVMIVLGFVLLFAPRLALFVHRSVRRPA